MERLENGCIQEPLPTSDMISSPKHDVVTVCSGSLTTNRLPSCPKLKLPVLIVFIAPSLDDAEPTASCLT